MAGDQPAAALVWCPFPDTDSARAVAGKLLDERLIACANILGQVESLFIWQGARSSGTETAVLFKTTADQLSVVVARLGLLHPYDTPAIIGWRCEAAHPATMAWLTATCAAIAPPQGDQY
jgi:periplasmic divalent cation tolerance protein